MKYSEIGYIKYKCDVLYRKKAKTSKSAATEVVSDNLQGSSIDQNKPESDRPENEIEKDLPMSQCRPMLLSQSGKFIPKFMAKKKIGDCVVKIECVSKLVESDNCSVLVSKAEIGTEPQPFITDSVADEVKDGTYAESIAVTDTRSDEPVLAECMVGLVANEHGATEQRDANSGYGLAESIGSNEHELPVDIALHTEDMGVNDHANDNECEGCTSVEQKENYPLNGEGEIEHYRNHADAEHRDANDAIKPPSLSSSTSISSEAAACMPAAEVAHEDCTEPKTLQITGDENNQRPVDTDEAIVDSKAVSDNNATATVQRDLSAEDQDVSVLVVESCCSDILQMPETVRDVIEAQTDSVSIADNGFKVAVNEVTDSNATIGKSDISDASGVKSKTGVTESDCLSVNSAATKDHKAPETADYDVELNTVAEAKKVTTGSSEPTVFDDFLDLTDSQLCQLDDVTR